MISLGSSSKSPENDSRLVKIVDGSSWISEQVGNRRHYTKHVSIRILDAESGKEGLYPVILGRTED